MAMFENKTFLIGSLIKNNRYIAELQLVITMKTINNEIAAKWLNIVFNEFYDKPKIAEILGLDELPRYISYRSKKVWGYQFKNNPGEFSAILNEFKIMGFSINDIQHNKGLLKYVTYLI
jgi:hypothetical protein